MQQLGTQPEMPIYKMKGSSEIVPVLLLYSSSSYQNVQGASAIKLSE